MCIRDSIERAKSEIKTAVKEADNTEKQSVTDLMELMYDEMPQHLAAVSYTHLRAHETDS